MTPARPIQDEEIGRLLDGLCPYAAVVLAVSGGADSVALMHLAARWRRSGASGPKLSVATVDHGLRPEAAGEALWVGEQARALGLAHATLRWDGQKPATGLMAAAREARYRLLGGLAQHLGTGGRSAVVTAHHLEDQAETLLMRLARGSGIDGLAAMPAVRPLEGFAAVDLVRPLLALPKARLAATLAADGAAWLEDPSNERVEFERVRLRRKAQVLAAAGLGAQPLALAALRLGRARQALAGMTRDLEAVCAHYHGGAYASLDRPRLEAAPLELRLRLLARALSVMGGRGDAPSLSKLEALGEALAGGRFHPATLHGCLVILNRQELRVFREPGRKGLPVLALDPGDSCVWDRRFEIAIGPDAGGPVLLKGLGPDGLRVLRAAGVDVRRMPARAAVALPSLWRGGSLLAVASLLEPERGQGPAVGDSGHVWHVHPLPLPPIR